MARPSYLVGSAATLLQMTENFWFVANPHKKGEVNPLQVRDPAGGDARVEAACLVPVLAVMAAVAAMIARIYRPQPSLEGGGAGTPAGTPAGVRGPPLPPPLLYPPGGRVASGRGRRGSMVALTCSVLVTESVLPAPPRR